MKCDKCRKDKSLYFKHISDIVICEQCYSKMHQQRWKKDWWLELELMYEGDEDDEEYEYYLDILDMIPNEEIIFVLEDE